MNRSKCYKLLHNFLTNNKTWTVVIGCDEIEIVGNIITLIELSLFGECINGH